MTPDDPKPKKKPPAPRIVVPMTRQQRRAQKRGRLKLIAGGKPADAPHVDTSHPAGRFALSLHNFMTAYLVAHADLEPSALCAAALQIAAKFAVELGGNDEEFALAASHFFQGEAEARRKGPPPPGVAG